MVFFFLLPAKKIQENPQRLLPSSLVHIPFPLEPEVLQLQELLQQQLGSLDFWEENPIVAVVGARTVLGVGVVSEVVVVAVVAVVAVVVVVVVVVVVFMGVVVFGCGGFCGCGDCRSYCCCCCWWWRLSLS